MASPSRRSRSLRHRQLAQEEERTLLHRWQVTRDSAAMGDLLDAYAPLVAKHAGGFSKYGLPREDLLQEGNLALINAADRFDLDRPVRFATYAVWWLRSAMQEYVLRNWSIVRLGTTRERKSLFFKLRHVQARIVADDPAGESRGAVLDRAAEMLNMPRDEVDRMDAVLRRGDHALNAPRAEEGEEWQAAIADLRPDPEVLAMEADDRRRFSILVAEALEVLTERERQIVEARRLDESPLTLRDLGARLGISTERVRQIEFAALEKMRCRLAAEGETTPALLAEPAAAATGYADALVPVPA